MCSATSATATAAGCWPGRSCTHPHRLGPDRPCPAAAVTTAGAAMLSATLAQTAADAGAGETLYHVRYLNWKKEERRVLNGIHDNIHN